MVGRVRERKAKYQSLRDQGFLVRRVEPRHVEMDCHWSYTLYSGSANSCNGGTDQETAVEFIASCFGPEV